MPGLVGPGIGKLGWSSNLYPDSLDWRMGQVQVTRDRLGWLEQVSRLIPLLFLDLLRPGSHFELCLARL